MRGLGSLNHVPLRRCPDKIRSVYVEGCKTIVVKGDAMSTYPSHDSGCVSPRQAGSNEATREESVATSTNL